VRRAQGAQRRMRKKGQPGSPTSRQHGTPDGRWGTCAIL
jgi:hypothetical protein